MAFDFAHMPAAHSPVEYLRLAWLCDCDYFTEANISIAVAFLLTSNGPDRSTASIVTARLRQGGTVGLLNGTIVGTLAYPAGPGGLNGYTGTVFTTTIARPSGLQIFTFSTEGDGTDWNLNIGCITAVVKGA
jgi:hypothetical protein